MSNEVLEARSCLLLMVEDDLGACNGVMEVKNGLYGMAEEVNSHCTARLERDNLNLEVALDADKAYPVPDTDIARLCLGLDSSVVSSLAEDLPLLQRRMGRVLGKAL